MAGRLGLSSIWLIHLSGCILEEKKVDLFIESFFTGITYNIELNINSNLLHSVDILGFAKKKVFSWITPFALFIWYKIATIFYNRSGYTYFT
jgi:hypothetical protein